MIDYNETEDLSPRHRPSGWKRFFKGALLVIGVLLFLAFLTRWQIGRIGQRQLDEMNSQLDTNDPGWRLDEIEAARKKAAPVPEKNSASVVIELSKSIPTEWPTYRTLRDWEWGPVTNYQPSFFEFIWLVGGQSLTQSTREAVRHELLQPEILNCPAGHYEIVQKENPIMTLLPHIEKARNVLAIIEYDARLSSTSRQVDRAMSSARTCLVVGKSIGDEPFLISQLVRLACDRVSVHTAMQILAWNEPRDGLAELQKEFRAEADVPWFQYGLRGERGMVSKLFDGLQSGKIPIEELEGITDKQSILQTAAFRAYQALLPGDQAKSLEILTAYLEVSKLPPHEQKSALAQIKRPPRPPEDFRYLVTNLLIPACEKVAEAGLRTRADLLTGSVAIACERYRFAKGKWPGTLAEIPRDILPDIPNDPYSGKPIQYQKLEDGVAVFCIGDEQDAKRRIGGDVPDPIADLGRGWKLWDNRLRGLPQPLPKTPR